jgi:hypothetical protein
MAKKVSVVLLGIFISFLVMSCNSKYKFVTEEIDGTVTMAIPNYLTPQDLDNADASLQYGNLYKEHYLMLIFETKEEIASYDLGYEFTLEDYAELTIESFSEAVDKPNVSQVNEKPNVINKMPSYAYELRGKLDEIDTDIYYYITILESDQSFYVIYSWCLSSVEDKYSADMIKIGSSIKEL